MTTYLYARCPGSPTHGEDRVKITSRWSATKVYVCRLVKSSGRWSKRRYLIEYSSIRRHTFDNTATADPIDHEDAAKQFLP